MSDERIGIVGAGSVGSQLACRLATLGYAPTVFDHDSTRAMPLERWGATTVQVPAEVAQDARMVILSLPNERAVDDTVFDCGGVTETLPDGGVVVNLSRTSDAYGREASRQFRRLGLFWLEAALIGKPVGVGRWAVCLAAGAGDADFGCVVQPSLLRVATQVTRLGSADDCEHRNGSSDLDTVARIRMAMVSATSQATAH